jgi:hypothetical protein
MNQGGRERENTYLEYLILPNKPIISIKSTNYSYAITGAQFSDRERAKLTIIVFLLKIFLPALSRKRGSALGGRA